MQKSLSWEGFFKGNRIEAIEQIKGSINNCGGSILNFNMFSDLALSLAIEIPKKKLKQLHAELSLLMEISELDNSILEELTKETILFFNVSFSKGTGNMKNEIPDVPG